DFTSGQVRRENKTQERRCGNPKCNIVAGREHDLYAGERSFASLRMTASGLGPASSHTLSYQVMRKARQERLRDEATGLSGSNRRGNECAELANDLNAAA